VLFVASWLISPQVTESRYQPGLHRVALLTAAATFPLIFMGGLVTSHGAGMSVPDWPNSYGYNMFTFPPSMWLGRQAGGVFYEHSHRLMGSVVGLLSIVLTVWAWRTEQRRWVRWLATSVLGTVIFQGVLGGLRVVLRELDLAVVHACVAQAFFCLAALTAVVTSRWWVQAPETRPANGPGIFRMAVVLVLVVYLQLVAGAVMRHYRAGLAIPDLPLAYGKLLPPVSERGLQAANEFRTWDAKLERVTLGQVWLHFTHRLGAVAVTLASLALVVRTVRERRRELFAAASVLSALLATQLTLGVLTVLWRKPADVASLHVATGALVLVTAFVIAVRAKRLNWLSAQKLERTAVHAGARSAPPRIHSGEQIEAGAELAPA
jgi:cytochrome c oxidase assembly protein subunit 15